MSHSTEKMVRIIAARAYHKTKANRRKEAEGRAMLRARLIAHLQMGPIEAAKYSTWTLLRMQ